MRLVTLSENSVGLRRGMLAEHGFSAYLEFGGYKIIFDAGQTTTCVHNASFLGVDLAGVPIALSHGHYDHAGGLLSLLERTGPVPVYAHPDVFVSRYSRRGCAMRQIGLPFGRVNLEGIGAEFDLSSREREIQPGLWLTGEIPRLTEFEPANEDLVVLSKGDVVIDPLLDDQALVLVLERGLFVLLGCAHAGMINTLEHAKRVTGVDTILGVAGGTHIGFGEEDKLPKTIEALRDLDLEILAPSHCTGFAAASALAAEFQDRFVSNNVGTEIVL